MIRLSARHTTTADGRPLVTISGLPGECADLTPDQICALARELKQIAIDSTRAASQRTEKR